MITKKESEKYILSENDLISLLLLFNSKRKDMGIYEFVHWFKKGYNNDNLPS